MQAQSGDPVPPEKGDAVQLDDSLTCHVSHPQGKAKNVEDAAAVLVTHDSRNFLVDQSPTMATLMLHVQNSRKI